MRRKMKDRWNDDDRIYLGLSIKEKLFPTILGGIVGDALGVPVEFKDRNLEVNGMTGYGTYNQPPGTWSDDSSLTLCLIENLIEENGEIELMEKFTSYREDGYWTPHGHMFDIGRTTDEAIERFLKEKNVRQCGGITEFDNGNGALMRISPLVFILCNEKDFTTRKREIERWAELTHAHPRSTLACIVYIQFLIHLFNNNTPARAFERATETCRSELSKDIKYRDELVHYRRVFDQSILDAKKEDIISDGYVVHSLEAALWCFFKHTNYRDAVLEAVNLGGDTDTIAFLTGTLAGMCYEINSIPEEWINTLTRKQDILDLCERFFQYCYKRAAQ
ncbi:ADP-ribosylglycohydrolase family protein [Bacillus sp. IS1]|uniref:ADP-ribosylglycohydrolase family protein n=1 Tax=Bacillus TaxID=1386 RepID=UPI000BA5555E|nr:MULTISPECIES: ADP-ribosylglycohydrolase family protein [Bacillus]MDU0076589.1 ADP-ribosylglycohydrolase family protein [Bacillus sp. IG2]MDU0103453.1 ADP-ribosylglycohydrolase family protein [Bacillus sp. IS1]MEC2270699.1 ADP-ribosylglycohydrolase family protein [Bacillus velezensis]MED3677995.1 ADP-ribosylglycohydrolase family protein [Bacillus velezensis]PAE99842.1 ADP-ribosylglycohydrolase [Bacillus velezensis]